MNESIELAWFQASTWETKWLGKGSEKEIHPLCGQEVDIVHVLLKRSETRTRREKIEEKIVYYQ
jgi:hypothetical protein